MADLIIDYCDTTIGSQQAEQSFLRFPDIPVVIRSYLALLGTSDTADLLVGTANSTEQTELVFCAAGAFWSVVTFRISAYGLVDDLRYVFQWPEE